MASAAVLLLGSGRAALEGSLPHSKIARIIDGASGLALNQLLAATSVMQLVQHTGIDSPFRPSAAAAAWLKALVRTLLAAYDSGRTGGQAAVWNVGVRMSVLTD